MQRTRPAIKSDYTDDDNDPYKLLGVYTHEALQVTTGADLKFLYQLDKM